MDSMQWLREMRVSLQQQQYGQGALAGIRLLPSAWPRRATSSLIFRAATAATGAQPTTGGPTFHHAGHWRLHPPLSLRQGTRTIFLDGRRRIRRRVVDGRAAMAVAAAIPVAAVISAVGIPAARGRLPIGDVQLSA